MIRTSKRTVALYVCLVFLSGALVGGLGYRFYTTRQVRADQRPKSADEYRRKYVEEMRSRLHLDESQIKQLGTILDATRSQYRESREKFRTAVKEIQQVQVEQVRAILTPEQRLEYEKMRAERDKRRKEEGDRHH